MFLYILPPPDNHYGTPKPPTEPSSVLNVTEQLLPGSTPSSQGKRRRNKSVSNMEKAGMEPPEEEEEEERPVVNGNGNGISVTPGKAPFPTCLPSAVPGNTSA